MTKTMTRKETISGWNLVPKKEVVLRRPEKYSELTENGNPKIAMGLGRSYGDAFLNTGKQVLEMNHLNRMLSFDEKNGLLRAEAGVSIQEIIETFLPRGWFVPVTPGTKFVTLGGCVAADVHGKNHHVDGGFGNYVRSLEVILADGTSKRCSPKKDQELFWATVGGMGLTGIISEVTIQLKAVESSMIQARNTSVKDLDQLFELLLKNEQSQYSVAWVDCLAKGKDLGKSILIEGDHASLDVLPSTIKEPLSLIEKRKISIPFHFPSFALNTTSVRAFNSLYHWMEARKKEPFITDYDVFFYPLDRIHNWNRIYGKRGFVQYQFVLPMFSAQEGVKRLLEKMSESGLPSFLAVLKKFGKEGSGMLSFPMEGMTLAVDLPISQRVYALLDECDEIVARNEGRVYLAKDFRLNPAMFRRMYPRFPNWLHVKRAIDPNWIYRSDLSQRLQLEWGA